ncbi:hypothetical protein ACH5AI_00720 [Streptomyces collinus]|uniref:hypothetical protein n=1 Tax=Streptomyces collinus TaxID=42684 RepID=UPI00379FD57B
MTEHPESQSPRPTRSIAWCSWHKGLSDTARLVGVHEHAADLGGNLFACQKCREMYGLTPIADQP